MKLRDVIAGVGCPGYTTDAAGKIIDLNRAAELMFGYDKRDVLGKKCYELIGCEDMSGNRLCRQECAVRALAERRNPISPFPLTMTTASGDRFDVKVHIVTYTEPGDDSVSIAHLIQQELRHGRRAMPPSTSPPGSELTGSDSKMAVETPPGARAYSLTQREVEVLRLMAQGKNCADISRLLLIAVATTRNHIRNILRKLNVHSQAEAISFTYRKGLL